MELIERYLQAVKFWLSKNQRQDIIAELSEDIHSQIEERESALGRKLTDDDVEQILKQRGRPLLVAEKYLPQKSLIGPVLFPAYRFVLKLALLCYLVPWAAVWIGLVVLNPSYRSHPQAYIHGQLVRVQTVRVHRSISSQADLHSRLKSLFLV